MSYYFCLMSIVRKSSVKKAAHRFAVGYGVFSLLTLNKESKYIFINYNSSEVLFDLVSMLKKDLGLSVLFY